MVAQAQFACDKLTGNTSAIQASVQLPDILVTTANATSPAYAKYFYIS